MAVTITSDLTQITTADATSAQGTWARVNGTSSGNPAAELDGKVQGAGCLVAKCGTTVAPTDVGLSVPLTATFNATGKHVFHWRNTSTPANMSTKANAGTSFHMSSAATFGTTNYKRWYLDGSDTEIIGGWKCYVIDPSTAGDISAGTLNLTAVKTLAFLHRQLSGVTTSLNNMQVDVVRIGTGITATASSGADTITFANLYATDSLNANAWGVVTQSAGIFYGAGNITVGATGQGNTCLFSDESAVLVWRKFPVADTLYGFNLLGAVSFRTTFQLTGCVVRGQAGQVWSVTCDVNSDFKAYGSSLANLLGATLSAGSVLSGCTIAASGTIEANGASVTDCAFSGATATQLKVDTVAEISSISNNSFTSGGTGHAISLAVAGSYGFSGLSFSGYAASNGSTGNEAVHVTATSGLVTITVSGGTSPSVRTEGATVDVVSGATVTFTGLPVGTDVVVLTAGTSTILAQIDANGGTSYAYGYSGTPTVDVGFIKPGYVPLYLRALALGSTDANIPVSLSLDRNYT